MCHLIEKIVFISSLLRFLPVLIITLIIISSVFFLIICAHPDSLLHLQESAHKQKLLSETRPQMVQWCNPAIHVQPCAVFTVDKVMIFVVQTHKRSHLKHRHKRLHLSTRFFPKCCMDIRISLSAQTLLYKPVLHALLHLHPSVCIMSIVH